MVDANDLEACAFDDAGALGGAYLEEIGKAEMAMAMTKDEWNTFIRVVCNGYVSTILDMQGKVNALAGSVQTREPPF